MYNVACPLKSCPLGGTVLNVAEKFGIVARRFECKVRGRLLLAFGCNTSKTVSRTSSAVILSVCKLVSSDKVSDSVF